MSNLPTGGAVGNVPPSSQQAGDPPRPFQTDVTKSLAPLSISAQVKLTSESSVGERRNLSIAPATTNLLPKTAKDFPYLGKPVPASFTKVQRIPQYVGQSIETSTGHSLQPPVNQSSLPLVQHSLASAPQVTPILQREPILQAAQAGPINLSTQTVPTVHTVQTSLSQPGPISLTSLPSMHATQSTLTQHGSATSTSQTMASIIRAQPAGLQVRNQPFASQVVKAAPPGVLSKHTVLRPAQHSLNICKPLTPPSDIRPTASVAQTVQITIQPKETVTPRGQPPFISNAALLSTAPKTSTVKPHPFISSITKPAVVSSAIPQSFGSAVTMVTPKVQPPVVAKTIQRSGQTEFLSTTDGTMTTATDPSSRHERPLDFQLPGRPGPHYFPAFDASIVNPQVPPQAVNLTAHLQGLPHTFPPGGSDMRLSRPVMTFDPARQALTQVITTLAEVTPAVSSTDNALCVGASSNYVVSAVSPGGGTVAVAPNASPRPSILRKRTADGSNVVRRTIPTPTGSETGSPRPESAPRSATNSPKPPGFVERDANSQSSTDTANSDGPPSLNSSMDVVSVKTEPMESLTDNGTMNNMPSSQHSVPESSPRKKPRKQLLHVSEELKDHNSSSDDEAGRGGKLNIKEEEPVKAEEKQADYVDEEGIHWVAMRRRNSSALLNSFNIHWKARNNHFLRYSDVKPKEERRPTVNELSNQKGIQQKISGWKLYHLATQLDEVKIVEKESLHEMTHLQLEVEGQLPRHTEYGERIHELMQANKQRLKLVIDQVDEARNSLLKILDHKARIQEIISKHHSKRQVKKKERT